MQKQKVHPVYAQRPKYKADPNAQHIKHEHIWKCKKKKK